MDKSIQIQVLRSSRKTIAMRITGPNAVEIRAPRTMSQAQIDGFIQQHQAWLDKHMGIVNQREQEIAQLPPLTEMEIRALAEQALAKIPARVRYFAGLLHVTYGRITIRNQKSKWGSCSSQGNLNFNWKLIMAPPEALDYVVIHELCHLYEFNHSPKFWERVARYQPDYAVWRDFLRSGWAHPYT